MSGFSIGDRVVRKDRGDDLTWTVIGFTSRGWPAVEAEGGIRVRSFTKAQLRKVDR